MNTYRVIIVDDDETALQILTQQLAQDSRFAVVATATAGAPAYRMILEEKPDLVFLDVELPDITGMSLLQELRNSVTWNMRVVFYTAYDKYMIQAIRESAFDYLLKPFLPTDLTEILNRFVNHYKINPRFQVPVKQTEGKTFIVFTPTNEMMALRPAEIGFFRYCSDRKLWEVISLNQPPLSLRRGVTAEQIIAFSPNFVQVHQSYIINIDYLMIIRESSCQMYPPFDKVEDLHVSKKFKKELQDRFCW